MCIFVYSSFIYIIQANCVKILKMNPFGGGKGSRLNECLFSLFVESTKSAVFLLGKSTQFEIIYFLIDLI